jgi:hypothetical protein
MKRSSTSNCFKSIGNSPSRKKTKGPFTARGNGRLSSTSYEWKNNKSREASEDFDAKLLKWPSLDSEVHFKDD